MFIRRTERYYSINVTQIRCLESSRSNSTLRLFLNVAIESCRYALDNRYHIPSRNIGRNSEISIRSTSVCASSAERRFPTEPRHAVEGETICEIRLLRSPSKYRSCHKV